MTNEEFTGHLMAALHGPKREEIVAAVGDALGLDLTARLVGKLAMWVLAEERLGSERRKLGREALQTMLKLTTLRQSSAEDILEVFAAISQHVGTISEETMVLMGLLRVNDHPSRATE